MELLVAPQNMLEEHLGQYGGLIGDKRTEVTFSEIVKGIITAGSPIYQQIAAHLQVLSAVNDGSQGCSGL